MKQIKNKVVSLSFIGCQMIGIAVGLLVGHTGPGTLLGMGGGFIAMVCIIIFYQPDNTNNYE